VIVLLQAYLDGQVSCHEREGVKSALSSCLSSAISGDASTRAKMRPDPYVLTCASLGAESSVHFIVSPDRLQ
jgi:hypothetical protein